MYYIGTLQTFEKVFFLSSLALNLTAQCESFVLLCGYFDRIVQIVQIYLKITVFFPVKNVQNLSIFLCHYVEKHQHLQEMSLKSLQKVPISCENR